MCFGCSKEPSHRGRSFEYPQHMFWMRNKENSFPLHTLIWRPGHMKCFLKLLAYWKILHIFLSSVCFFSKSSFFNSFRNTNSLDPDQVRTVCKGYQQMTLEGGVNHQFSSIHTITLEDPITMAVDINKS